MSDYGGDRRTTRRVFLRGAASTTASAAGAMALGSPIACAALTKDGKRVVIFGGGVAGLSAAHELAERGFKVTVYERDHLGGKAWSFGVPGSATPGRNPLQAEHGFRFFPGFYKNLGDTMRRIPVAGGSVYDRLVRATTYRTAFAGGPDLTIPLTLLALDLPVGVTPEAFAQSLAAVLVEALKLPLTEALYFASKLWVYVSSCEERRFGQWDYVPWSDFIRENQMSAEYRKVVSRSLVRNLAATKSDQASTHSIGLVGEASVMSLAGYGNDAGATFDRVLDGPSSEVWLNEWVALLRRMGVRFRVGWTLERLTMRRGRIAHALVRGPGNRHHHVADPWFVLAIPFERVIPLLSSPMLKADPRLDGIRRLANDWMSGLQFYLYEPFPLTNGHVNYADSPFALTSISQQQFWQRPLSDYGDGTVTESFSTIVSDWVTPGIIFGKPAKELTPPQLAREVYAQIQAHENKPGSKPTLTDQMLHSWFLDPAIKPFTGPGSQRVYNDTPLFIQNPGEWANRPESATAIPNLFLAGDWVRTNINVTTMDGANQGGRQAANALLDAAGSSAPRAQLSPLYVPPEFEPFRELDRARYSAGQPNVFDPDQAAPGGRL
jgi:uncharacterized protein with NAD-binding domain and iron-sulfur cluster